MSDENDVVKETNASSVECGVSMDIASIHEMKETLEKALHSDDPVLFLNADQVERADAAALQLLAAFFDDAHKVGFNIQWHKPSAALQRSVSLLGLNEQLELNA